MEMRVESQRGGEERYAGGRAISTVTIGGGERDRILWKTIGRGDIWDPDGLACLSGGHVKLIV